MQLITNKGHTHHDEENTFRSSNNKTTNATTENNNSNTKSNPGGANNTSLRVALCQFKVTEDKSVNHNSCQEALVRASGQGAQLVVLPEMWASPYATAAFPVYAEELPSVGDGGETGFTSTSTPCPSAELLRKAAVTYKYWIVGGSIAERDPEDGKVYNTCLVFNPSGVVAAKHRKVHLVNIDVPGGIRVCEPETLSAGKSLTDFETPWCRIGVGICYDIRFAAYAMLLQQRGCEILIYPSAFNMTTGPPHWEALQKARALDNQCFVLTSSPARSDDEDFKGATNGSKYPRYTAYGHSTAVSPWGEVVASADEKEDVVIADLDLTTVGKIRQWMPMLQHKRADLYRVDSVVGSVAS